MVGGDNGEQFDDYFTADGPDDNYGRDVSIILNSIESYVAAPYPNTTIVTLSVLPTKRVTDSTDFKLYVLGVDSITVTARDDDALYPPIVSSLIYILLCPKSPSMRGFVVSLPVRLLFKYLSHNAFCPVSSLSQCGI